MGKVKVFVHADTDADTDADADADADSDAGADAGGTTIALRTFVPVS